MTRQRKGRPAATRRAGNLRASALAEVGKAEAVREVDDLQIAVRSVPVADEPKAVHPDAIPLWRVRGSPPGRSERLAGHASPQTTARYDRRGEAAKRRTSRAATHPLLARGPLKP